MAIKLEGGGCKALVARPLVDELFFLRLPLPNALAIATLSRMAMRGITMMADPNSATISLKVFESSEKKCIYLLEQQSVHLIEMQKVSREWLFVQSEYNKNNDSSEYNKNNDSNL